MKITEYIRLESPDDLDALVIHDSTTGETKHIRRGDLLEGYVKIVDKTTSVATIATLNPSTPINNVTAQTTAISIAEPTLVPYESMGMTIKLKDNGTPRAISHTADYQATMGTAFPTTTVANKRMILGYMYDGVAEKWDLISVIKET